MNGVICRRYKKSIYRFLSAFIAFTFSFTTIVPPGYAQLVPQTLLNLPAPGVMVTPSAAFVPVLLKGMTIHPENPLQFDFIIDSGNTDFKEDQIKEESQRLVKYFLASMTIPKDDLWVNLSPYESDKIIPDELGKTELGRDMLAQDYILKQLTASLMYPEKELGKEFWSKVYKLAQEKYGTTEIPVNTFNKVWILPETATVYEHGQTVYIVDAKLKVMLDSDYEAQKQDASPKSGIQNPASGIETSIIKEIILPEIEKEVNEGQNFAPLRQIYHSLILAKWYKETIKESLLSKIYVDQKKIAGVESGDETLKDQIYAQYMEAYKKGVFNYIKEDYDQLSNQPIPRKYFSGGLKGDVEIDRTNSPSGIEESAVGKNYQLAMEASPQKDGAAIPKKSSSPVWFFGSNKKQTLGKAVLSGELRVVRKLLEQGADPNSFAPNDNLGYPIHYAINAGPKMVQLLIDYGADVNVLGRSKTTPLAAALSRGLTDVADVLKTAGAKIHSDQDQFWMDPIFRLRLQNQIVPYVLAAAMRFPATEIVEKVESKLNLQFPAEMPLLERKIIKEEIRLLILEGVGDKELINQYESKHNVAMPLLSFNALNYRFSMDHRFFEYIMPKIFRRVFIAKKRVPSANPDDIVDLVESRLNVEFLPDMPKNRQEQIRKEIRILIQMQLGIEPDISTDAPSSSPVEKTADAPLSAPAIKNIIKELKIIRKSFADEKYLEQENLVHEALEELLGYIDKGVEIDSPVLNLYFLTKIMLKPLKASPGLFRNGGIKEPTQIFLVDEANQEVLVSQRGLYKRLFARKWAPSVNTEKTDNDGIKSAIEEEVGIVIDSDRLRITPQRFKTQMISYDLYALDTAENRALKKAAQKMSDFSDPVHGIAVEYDEKRMAVIVYSVNDQVNQDAVREVAEQVQRLSKIPYMYPVYEQNHSRFAIYPLTQEEKARIQERIAHNSNRKGIAQKNIVSGQYSDKTRLQSDLIDWDSDDMVFRPIEDILEEYRKTPGHFTLDLIVPYLEDLSVWRSILPKGQYVIPVNSPWLADLSLSGGKGGNLKRLQQLADNIKGLHIPRTAAISIPAFEEIILQNPEIVNLINQLDAVDSEEENSAIAQEIRERIVNIVLTEAFKDQVRKSFEDLGGDIAVRSSANAEDIKDFSASGLGESFLHVTSVEDVYEKIKEVWSSLYADGFIQERRKRGIKNVNAKMAVVLQEFINAVAAGVVNSYDDASFRAAYKIISNWGLGESVVQGKGLHDKWIVGVNPADKYDILEEEIAQKTKITLAKNLSGIESLEINPDKDYVHPVFGDLRSKSVLPSLSDEDIIFIAQNAQGIHRYYQRHGWAKQVDIEFAKNAAGQIYIVQTRPLNVNTADFHKITVEVVDTKKVPEGTVQFDLSEGTTAQIGTITAKLLVTANIPTVQEANNVIVVTSNTNNAWNHVFSNFKGVITQQGREVAHATNNSRENKIPCMVGVPTAMEMLKDYSGEEVTFDAYSGKIYLGRMPTKEIEIETTFWVNELDKLQEVLADLKPHELRRPFSESMKAWSAVFHRYYDGNFRRRSAIYESFQLDYYYAAWDRLTEYLNERYEGRRPFKLRTQKRIIRDSGLFNRIVEEDQSTIFHFIKGIKDLSIDDLWDLYNDRLEGLNRFREYFHNLQTVDENNVDEVMDQLIEGFKWMHFAYWLGAAIYELYATKQTVYINGLFQPVAQNGALSVLDEKFLTNISRERDMEIQIFIEKIRRDEKLVSAQNAENAQDLANFIQKTRPELHEKIKGLSDQYRRNTEDIRVIDETLEYYRTLLNGLLSADAEVELFAMAMKNKIRKYKFGKEADLNEIKEKHPDFYYLLGAYARRVIAGERAGENANRKVWALNNTPAAEIEQSIKRAYDELFQAAKDEMGEEEKYFSLIKSYPRLIKTLQLDKIERTLREDGHHIAVQAQRPLAKALLEAAKRTVFFVDPEEIFQYSTAEVAAILKEENPEYIKRSLEWRKIVHEADLSLLHVWEKLSKDGTMTKEMFFILNIPYHKFLMKMYSAINIIDEQINQARSEQLREWYLSEKNRLMERIADVKFIIDSHVFSPNGGHLQQYKENAARKIEASEALIKKILDPNDPSAFFEHFQQGVEANRKQDGKELLAYFPINENSVLSSLIGEITNIVKNTVTSPEEESTSKNTYVSVDNSYISLAIYERAAETLRLDFERIANLVSKNADTMGPFVVKLIGPRLMPDGFVILEYEVISPEINALRDLTQKDILAEENRAITEAAEGIFTERIKGRLSQLSKEEKAKIQEEAFEEAKRAFKNFGSVIPNIYHSTIAIIKDRSVTQKMLINLERQFKNIRDDIKFQQPQLFLIDYLALSEIDVKTRQFGKVFKTSLAIEDAGEKVRSSSPMMAKELKEQIAEYRKVMADPAKSELERNNARENLESVLTIIRRDIFLIEDQLNAGRPLDPARVQQIDNLMVEIRSGKFELKGEAVDILRKPTEDQVNALRNAASLEEGETIIKGLKLQGTMDRDIAEKGLGYFHQTANAFILTPDVRILNQVRVPWKKFGLFESIYGGHLIADQRHPDGILKELLEELGFLGKQEELSGELKFAGFDVFEDSDPKSKNKEVRSLFVYKLTPAEWTAVEKEIAKLKKAREAAESRVRELNLLPETKEYNEVLEKTFKESLGAEKSGLGEVWDIKIVTWDQLNDAASLGNYTPDLLRPIMQGDNAIKTKVKNILDTGFVQSSLPIGGLSENDFESIDRIKTELWGMPLSQIPASVKAKFDAIYGKVQDKDGRPFTFDALTERVLRQVDTERHDLIGADVLVKAHKMILRYGDFNYSYNPGYYDAEWEGNGPNDIPEYLDVTPPDNASSGESRSPVTEQQGQGPRDKDQGMASDELGGIDMNTIDLDRQGVGVDIQFDPAQLQELIDAGIDGFAPVIINITPLPSVLPLLGLDPAIKEESLELSSSG